MTDEKRRILDLAARHVCPHRVEMLQGLGVDLVIGRREGYRIWDVDGRELLDFHLNGGVFNLGHRNPEVIDALRQGLETLDIGNHHFPSPARAELAAALVATAPGTQYAVFAPSGGEAIEIAIKSARHATQRRAVVSIRNGYHGHTGLALAAGDERAAALFLSQGAAGEFVHVPFNDLAAMAAALAGDDVAAVVVETIPATSGFPLPEPGYLPGVKALCERHGAMYIADEVQTGLGRTGHWWAVQRFGVQPDILVTGKGLSGGIYPIAAALLAPRAAGWLQSDGWGHVSTFGGAELGCRVGLKVLEITARPEVLRNVAAVSERLGAGLEVLRRQYGDWLVEVRRCGVVMGLRFANPRGAMLMAKHLYDAGIWAMFAGFDPSVLQFKAGMLIDAAYCDEALTRFADGLRRCTAALAG